MKRIVTLLGLCWVGCSPAPGGNDGGVEGPHFLYSVDPQSLDNPFPDARLTVDGVTTVRPDWYRPFLMRAAATPRVRAFLDGYAARLASDVPSFGNLGPTLLRFSEPLDATTLSGHVHRLRQVGEGYEVLERDVVVQPSSASLDGTTVTVPDDLPQFAMVRPGRVLREGERGLLVVTKGVKTAGGVELERGRDFAASGAPLEAAAAALGVGDDEVLLTLPEQAALVTPVFESLLAWVDGASGQPAVTIPPHGVANTNPVGVWATTDLDFAGTMKPFLERYSWSRPADHVDRVVVGELGARDLREGGRWKKEWVADPSQAPVVPLRFVLTVPKGPKPDGGWKTVIGAHGIGGRNTPRIGNAQAFCPELAEYFARAGYACLGIDAPNHGERGSFLEFFDVADMTVTRDEFREMTFDLMQLRRAAPGIDVDGDGVGDLASEVFFFGNSLGAIMGSSYVPLDQKVKVAVLNVPGGGLSNILSGDAMRDRIGLLIAGKTDLPFGTAAYYSAFPLMRTLSQPLLEGGDPINAASRLSASQAVLQQMGVGDGTIPNFTSENLRDAFGLVEKTADEPGDGQPLHVFFRADPNAFNARDLDGHNVFFNIKLLRDQAIGFFVDHGVALQATP